MTKLEEMETKKKIKNLAEQIKLVFFEEFDEVIPSIMAERIDKLVTQTIEARVK